MMKICLVTLYLVTIGFGLWPDSGIQIEPTLFRQGDASGWSATDLEDGDWTTVHPGGKGRIEGILWSRTHIVLDAFFETNDALMIDIHTLASYEIFWDGVPVGRNGQPGSSLAAEVPGPHFKSVVIPKNLIDPGQHVLALRISSWRAPLPSNLFKIEAGPLEKMALSRELSIGFYMAVLALLLAAGFTFLVYGHEREIAVKRFGWLCLAVAVLLALENGKYLVHYPYPLHLYRLVTITGVTLVVATLLPWFLMARLGLSGWRYLSAAVIPPLLIPFFLYDPDLHCYWIFVYTLVYSLFLCVCAAQKGHTGWQPITVVVGLGLILITQAGDRFADRWFFPSFLLMVALLSARLIWETRVWREALITQRLTSARLEVELLRKSIQPHFLKNTLAAAMAWFEENPKKGARLLGSLADELDCFFRIGDRDRIKLEEELALCRQHIETMSYLLDCALELKIKGLTSGFELPPGMLITCVENALTHGEFSEGNTGIEMTIILENGCLRIRVANPAEPTDSVTEGTGTRYLQALLTRHYPKSWSLTQGYDGCQWVVTISIQTFSNESFG